MTQPRSLWILDIIDDIDDRKRRGRAPQGNIYLETTKEKALQHLVNKIHETMGDLYGTNLESINKQLLPYLQINKDECSDAYEIKEEFVSDENELSFIHSIVAKGEYVPLRWSYKLYQEAVSFLL